MTDDNGLGGGGDDDIDGEDKYPIEFFSHISHSMYL